MTRENLLWLTMALVVVVWFVGVYAGAGRAAPALGSAAAAVVLYGLLCRRRAA